MAPVTDRKEQIYSTAGALFSQKGYHATSMRDIASELEIQGGSLYSHISSKEDVLWELVQRAAKEFEELVEPVAREPLAASERLQKMIRAHVAVVTHRLEDATVFFHEWRFLGAERRRQVAQQRDRYEAAFRGVIQDGVSYGEFRQVDPKLAALMVLSSVNWLYQWYTPGGPLSQDEVADGFSELLLGGLRAT